MITRMVNLKLKSEFKKDVQDIASYSEQTLRRLNQVEQIRALVSADQKSCDKFDLVLVLEFKNLEAVESYIPDPIHRHYVGQYLKPKLQSLQALNYLS